MEAQGHRSSVDQRSAVPCPVVVHRWFSGGEGWAWCSGHTPGDFVGRLADVLRTRPAAAPAGLLEAGPPWWLYHHAPDQGPVDPKARGRQPSILRAVALPSRPKSSYRDALAQRLAELPLPERPGEASRLFLEVPQAWLEAQKEGEAPPTPPKGESPGGYLVARRWIGRVLLMTAMVACLVAVVLVFVYPGTGSGAVVSANDVRKELLEPLGVDLGPSASEQEICERFCRLYCQQGMVAHFFPGATMDDVKQAAENARHANGGSPTASGSSAPPDVLFAREQTERLKAFWSAIADLPQDRPRDATSHGIGRQIGQAFDPTGELTKAVNAVAKRIPEEKRSGPDKTVAGASAVRILHDAVVKPLENAGLPKGSRRGEYERWFFETFRWEAGQPFPWDQSPDPECRKMATLFSRQEESPSDVRKAAEEMRQWLNNRDIAGISEEDVQERPWFVGRCFVEFLSLKHRQLSDDQLKQLDSENSLVWQQLKNLPSDGWPVGQSGWEPSKATSPWQPVKERLQALAKGLDVGTSGSDSALVQRITNAIGDWPAEANRVKKAEEARRLAEKEKEKEVKHLEGKISECESKMNQLDNEVRELERRLSELPLGSDQRKKTESEINAKKKEWGGWKNRKSEASKQLDDLKGEQHELGKKMQAPPGRSRDEPLNQLWKRLTGSEPSAVGPAVGGQ
jgi:hypothetical protein